MTPGRLIVITGLDGSGKDYVAEHLKDMDSASNIVRTPTEPFIPARLNIDTFALEVPAAHYFFYLASVIHASSLIEEALKKGDIYCVRYLLDTVVYHRAMGLCVELEYETPFYKIRKPDFTFFLAVDDEQVRQERLKTRGKVTVGDKIVDKESVRNAILDEYQRFSREFITINNCARDVADVVAEIRKWL
jgi:thymidylate kinase